MVWPLDACLADAHADARRALRRLEQQAASDRANATQKEHTFEVLMMDKAYLTKQVREWDT